VLPLVLLDVDGVLNALARPPDVRAWQDWQLGQAVADGRSWPIAWSPSVVDAVRGWRDRADVQWLTTWGHNANDSLRQLLDLPELPVAGTHQDGPVPQDLVPQGEPDAAPQAHASIAPAAPDELTGRWWKFDVVRHLVRTQPGRRLVWVDDDLDVDGPVGQWMDREADCLLVVPFPVTGLVAADLAAVDAYLSA